MELKIYSPKDDNALQAIEWNHEEIKAEVTQKVEMYKTLVYTDDQVTSAKADKAKLNKFVTALEDKRKEIKRKYLEPYETFEKQVKDIVAIVNEPIALIDSQIKAFDEEKKAKKAADIKEYWDSLKVGEIPTYEQIFNPKWLNASTSMASIKKDIENILIDVENALNTLDCLPEYSFEAKDVYKKTLDVTKAINEANRLVDVAKRKAEEEKRKAELKAQEEAKKAQEEAAKALENPIPERETVKTSEVKDEPSDLCEPLIQREWIGFEAYLSSEEAKKLASYLKLNNIKFRRPTNN